MSTKLPAVTTEEALPRKLVKSGPKASKPLEKPTQSKVKSTKKGVKSLETSVQKSNVVSTKKGVKSNKKDGEKSKTKKKMPVVTVEDEETSSHDEAYDEEMSFTEEKKSTLVPIEEGITKSEFFIPSLGRFKLLRTMIKPSTIKGAGMGVFALDPIPKGSEIKYAGVKKGPITTNHFYSWEVRTYDPETGEPDDEEVLYFIDASDTKYSNCTRTVNCGMTNAANNMDAKQRFGKFYYIAMRDIKSGEELFVDYGPEYRKVNLGMKGKY